MHQYSNSYAYFRQLANESLHVMDEVRQSHIIDTYLKDFKLPSTHCIACVLRRMSESI